MISYIKIKFLTINIDYFFYILYNNLNIMDYVMKQQTTNNKQQTTNNKQQTTNNKQQTTNNKQLYIF